jgi:hypothetical protein
MRPYNVRFDAGVEVVVATRGELEVFQRTWKFHNPLHDEQLGYANTKTHIAGVGFYHGSDPLYELEGVPGA